MGCCMKTLAKIEAVLLDMDGTLVDSDASVERAWRVWCSEYGVEASDVLEHAPGHPAATTVRRVRPDWSDARVEQAARRQLALQYDDLSDVIAAPGAVRLLATLDRLGLAWCVVTSADRTLARARLSAAGIDPPRLITVDDVRHGKPDPEGYLLAAALLGVDPGHCLVVEDAPPGLAAGHRAGMVTASLRGLQAEVMLTDLGQLAWLLSGWHDPGGWWTDAVGYEVYLPSFQDSNADGWGDLPGVTRRLDYLVTLGVDLLWLTPFFSSPMRDHGYDVADYLTVDPSFGADAGLDDLVRQAHRRGLRVVGDLVVNHTSDQHAWFRAAAESRDNPLRDYYIWRDPAPGGGPPNNWLSHFGGPAWTLSERTGQYYLHLFKPEQPDLNWRNPAVAEEVAAILEYWFARGLDGFRIDTAAYLLKHPELPNNPLLPLGTVSAINGVTAEWRGQDHLFDIHQPDVHAIHEGWRRIADRHDAFLVGEVYELIPQALACYVAVERLHSSFWFGLVDTDWNPQRMLEMILSAAAASPRLSWVQGNHDRSRAATRYGGGELGRRRTLAIHALMAFLPGTFWLYQGEELGLPNAAIPAGQGADPLADAQPDQSRDVARTPMPWQHGPEAGFTTGTAWLPVGQRPRAHTVADQLPDPGSHLSAMRRLLAVRRDLLTDPLGAELKPCPAAEGLAGYRRGHVFVLANLDDAPRRLDQLTGSTVFDTDDPTISSVNPGRAPTHLAPLQALVIRLDPSSAR